MTGFYETLQKRPLEEDVVEEGKRVESSVGKKLKGEDGVDGGVSDSVSSKGSVESADDENSLSQKDILEQTKADELDEVVDDYAEEAVASSSGSAMDQGAGKGSGTGSDRADAVGDVTASETGRTTTSAGTEIKVNDAKSPSNENGNGTNTADDVEQSSNAEKEYLPVKPENPIHLEKDPVSGKYIFPAITKEDSLNARSYLKHFGSTAFLNDYLPEDLNSLYVYHMIKLLGFQIKDKDLMSAIQEVAQTPESFANGDTNGNSTNSYPSPGFEDPLEKKHAVRLIKDLQKAMNKVLSTRIRLTNFHTIDDFVAKLKTAKKIIVLTGAGISTSLGIPDFRSSEGFYSKLGDLGLSDPQDVFSLEIFSEDPSVFYNIAHMVLPPENMYSPLHSFIRMIQDKHKLLRNYTQNIDNLESYAGVEPEKMVQCHGSFATASCVTCHWKVPGERIFPNIRNLQLPICPYCYSKRVEFFKTKPDDDVAGGAEEESDYQARSVPKSFGVLKPDITFFGEALPSKFHRLIREDVLQCDLLICIGTSLKVAPVSEIVNMIPASVPQVLINKDPVKHAEFDLSLLGLCDDVAALVAQKCGWDIPHHKWNDLKSKEFVADEVERGIYNVYPKQTTTEEAASAKNLPLQQSTAALTPPASTFDKSPTLSVSNNK
ncbi:NAD-dependent histone deacetylase sir2 [Kluyveromyces marxianus]|nr:NAD-dependent histone deacetylase sir2 [Kluyveromyces marxianus]